MSDAVVSSGVRQRAPAIVGRRLDDRRPSSNACSFTPPRFNLPTKAECEDMGSDIDLDETVARLV